MDSVIGAQICANFEGNILDPAIIAYLNSSRLDLSKEIPDPQQLVSADGLPLCTRGNISVVTGLPGSRKSFLCTAIAGAFVADEGFLGLENPNEKGVLLWFDTEQADGHVARIGRRLHRIAGFPTDKSNDTIEIHMLREYTYDLRRKIIEAGIKLTHPDFVVIDGIADLIADPNSPAESSEIVSWLMAASKTNNCHILTVVHTNVGNEKARGHLGSEVMRKAETALYVEAAGEVSKVSFKKTRDIAPEEFSFTIKEGLPAIGKKTGLKPDKQAERKRLAEEFFNQILHPGETLSYSRILYCIQEKAGISEAGARKRLKSAFDLGVVRKNEVGNYLLAGYEAPQQIEFNL